MNNFNSFLRNLEKNLYFFSGEEIEQILLDYKELYNVKLESGKTEQEILKELDSPTQIANNFAKEMNLKTSSVSKMFINTKKTLKKYLNKSSKNYKKIKNNLKIKKQNVRYKGKNFIKNYKENKESKFTKEKKGSNFFFDVIKNIFYFFIFVCTLCFKFIRRICSFAVWVSIVVLVLIYILSFVFIEIDFYGFYYRLFETTAIIGYIMCATIIILLLKDKSE